MYLSKIFLIISDKELLIRHKFKWSESDNDPEDNRLSVKEFHAFQHPEQSPIMMDRMVKDILESLGSWGGYRMEGIKWRV